MWNQDNASMGMGNHCVGLKKWNAIRMHLIRQWQPPTCSCWKRAFVDVTIIFSIIKGGSRILILMFYHFLSSCQIWSCLRCNFSPDQLSPSFSLQQQVLLFASIILTFSNHRQCAHYRRHTHRRGLQNVGWCHQNALAASMSSAVSTVE